MGSDQDPPFLIFGAPTIGDPEIAEVTAVLKEGWLGTGPRTSLFEDEFAAYQGASGAVALNSCTAALHLSILAAGIGPGDEVITSALTFCATVNAVIHAGATPVLVDCDPVTMNIDPKAVARAITKKTKAILPVHFAGRPCDMNALTALAKDRALTLIEDCAHAIETRYHDRPAGTFGDFGCFSFYVTKNVACGEGGMVLARRKEDADRIKVLAMHGMSHDAWRRYGDTGYKHYQVVAPGFKYNMMDLQAAIGLHQLRRVEDSWKKRSAIWTRYQDAFADLPVVRPADPEPSTRHAYHLYTLLIDADRGGKSRDAFLDAMSAQGIGTGVHYLSIPEHAYYQTTYGWRPEDFPEAMRIGRSTISLPLSPGLSQADSDRVIAAVRTVLSAYPA